MASITPSDGGYNYQSRSIEELEDDLKNQAARSRKNDDERIDRIAENSKREIQKAQDKFEEAGDRMRNENSQSATRQRDRANEEIAKMKREMYDRFGRSNGLDAEMVKDQLENTKASSEALHNNDQRALKDQDDSYRQKLADQNQDHALQQETNVETARDSANERYNRMYEQNKANYDETREEGSKKYEELNRERMADQNYQRRQFEKAFSETQRDFNHRLGKAQADKSSYAEMLNQTYTDKSERETRALSDSHNADTQTLRDQIKEASAIEKRMKSEKAQGMSDAVAEFENDHRAQKASIVDSYEREIDKLKRVSKDSDKYMARVNNENLKAKDEYFADLITVQGKDRHERERELITVFDKDRTEMDKRMRFEREQATQTLERQLGHASGQREIALKTQAKAYQDTISRNTATSNEQVNALSKELQFRKTSADASAVSPAAEAGVRASMQAEYEKILAAERDRSGQGIDSVQKSYAERLTSTVVEADTKATTRNQAHTTERDRDRRDFVNHVQDVEMSKDESLRHQESDHTRATDNLTRNYAGTMERQRRQYDELLNTTRDDASAKLQTLRQEKDFESRMTQKAFSAKQNELIRDYEKRLTDQKAEHDTMLTDIKGSADQMLRSAERKSRQDMEAQAKSYDQRIKQLEVQHEERERYMTQNFQENLEKMKRSNAELVKKKS